MKLARFARLAGSAWELARFALLLSAVARLAAGEASRLVPLLVPLAAPGLVMAAGLAAASMLEEARAGLLPLLRMGKLLEAFSAIAAVAASFFVGVPADIRLVGLLAATALVDLVLFLLLLFSDRKAAAPGGEAAGGGSP